MNRVWNVIKKILIIITSPIWYPWKLLFVRSEEKKFKNVSTKTKVFRIIRGFITKPAKFAVYVFIISLEVLLIYKLRYSPVTYHFTRNRVHSYYLQKESLADNILGVVKMKASNIENHNEEIKTAFSYIDNWSLDEKNKMYVLLDAKITKLAFKYTDDESISYVLNKFNTNEKFRDDIKYAAKNVNNILSRAIREFPSAYPYDEINMFNPVFTLGSYAVDYREVLDALGLISDTVLGSSEYEITEEAKFRAEDIDLFTEMIIDFNNGMSIKEAYDKANKKYLEREDYQEMNATVVNN